MVKKLFLLIALIGLTGILIIPNVWAEPDPAAIQKLYEAAKAEGEVLWQVGGRLDSFIPLAKAFEEKYPGVKCKPFSSSASGIAAKLITEANAGKVSMDLGSTMTHFLLPLLERDLLLEHDWSKTSDMDPDLIASDGRVVISNDHCPIWVYNKNLVKKADIPKTWEDLLDPKWKGAKISMRAMGAALGGLFPEWKKNPEKVEAFIAKLGKQKVVPGTRYSLVMKRVMGGETPLGLVMGAEIYVRQGQGAPIEVLPISPTANAAMTEWIPRGAKHPNAAKLLESWLSSKEGRKLRAKVTGAGLAYPPDASPLAKTLFENKIEYYRITTADAKEYNRYSKIAEGLMGFAPK